MSSPQSVGGPRAGDTGGGSSGSPRCVRIFRIGLGSVMNAISLMSLPQFGHSSGNSSPTRAMSFAQAIREVSCEGLAPAAQQSVPVPVSLCFPAFSCSRVQPGMQPGTGTCSYGTRNTSQSPPDGERRDGPPQLVIRREYSVVAMPVLPRRPDEIGEPVKELIRREFDDAVGPRPR